MTRRAIQVGALAAAAALLITGCDEDPVLGVVAHTALASSLEKVHYLGGRSEPVADPVYPEYGNPAIDVLHYDLDLAWAADTKTLTGTADVTIRAMKPLTEISLDLAGGMTVTEARLGGVAVTPRREGNKLILPAPKPIAADGRIHAVIRYQGVPKQVPMPASRLDALEGLGLRPTPDGGAWTMQEPFGAFTWYPCSDQPSDEALYDIHLTAPAGMTGVASGTYEGVQGGKALFRSTEPVATYVTTLAFGKYAHTKLTGPHGIPISLWTRPEDAQFMDDLKHLPDYLTFLEGRFGPYPMSSAGVVMVPSASAMETQEMMTIGSMVTGSRQGEEMHRMVADVLVHELAHQWFGDAITPKDWRGVWLNEGWAQYADGQYMIDKGWMDAPSWEDLQRRIDAKSRPLAGPPGHFNPKHFASGSVYAGPAMALQEIRAKVGDQVFFAMAKDWVQTQRHSHQDRASFTAFVNNHTKQDMAPIISKWLDSPTTP